MDFLFPDTQGKFRRSDGDYFASIRISVMKNIQTG